MFWMTLVTALAGVSTQASAQVPLHDSRYEMVTTQLDQNISFGESTINYLGQNISAWRIGLDRPHNPGARAALTLAHSVNLTNRDFVICHWRSICTTVRHELIVPLLGQSYACESHSCSRSRNRGASERHLCGE
jgi:hypothetical protein